MTDSKSPLDVFKHKEKAKKVPEGQALSSSPSTAASQNYAIDQALKKLQQGERETRAMINQIYTMRAEIEKQLNDIVALSKFSKEEIWKFLENQHNFTSEQWKLAQEEQKELARKVWDAVQVSPIKRSEQGHISAEMGGGHQKKGKVYGSRRKWISTR